MKIGLCGTMSVGKTTLVNALKQLPEFADYNFETERSNAKTKMKVWNNENIDYIISAPTLPGVPDTVSLFTCVVIVTSPRVSFLISEVSVGLYC